MLFGKISKTPWQAIYLILFSILLSLFWFSVKAPLFNDPTCTVITDRNGDLLAATISKDGQYRFPASDSIPRKFKKCLVAFEDKYFFKHPGVNPLSILRAVKQNIKSWKVVSGGSTITMQVIRLSRKNKPRTVYEKLVEIIKALRLEITYSKDEILKLYSSHAPFGGNVVGLDAAAWRYFGRSPDKLSWAESASMAILPNAPSIIFPGKNKNLYLKKRNDLLRKLFLLGDLDSLSYSLAIQEPLPSEPNPLPQIAPHLLTRTILDGYKGQNIKTSINAFLQKRVDEILDIHRQRLVGNSIHNAAVLVIKVETGEATVYVGNTKSSQKENSNYVDCIQAQRSTGSILKPFLYAAMLNEGLILPNTLVPDIPTQISGYTPKNFNPSYDGAVPASRALARSLNVPAVRMLHTYGVEKFHDVLNRIGLTTINRSANSYGLSLILGGAEAKLWDLAGVYSSFARTLKHYRIYQSRYNKLDFHLPTYIYDTSNKEPIIIDNSIINAGAIYQTFEAMKEVARPDELSGWKYFASTRSVAWKTGTSYGHRDAWAIGLNPDYVVAVWVGNASGEGRPDLTGVSIAAPILFEVFGLLPECKWFEKPYDDMAYIPVCRNSGQRATNICETIDSVWIPIKGLDSSPCPYHKIIHLDRAGKYRVTDKCEDISMMKHVSWFILPPAMEWFYKSKNQEYKVLPQFAHGCNPDISIKSMAIIYPRIFNSKISIPKNIDGTKSETIFEIAHRRGDATVFWHLDEMYLGTTSTFHKMALNPTPGKHVLTLVDELGETLVTKFEIVNN